ncbi:MAG: NapC/NirT family cytochrome c [Cyanobacteriota bacterium]
MKNIIHNIKNFYINNKTKALAILSIIIVIAFISLYWSVEITSTPEFCISCHEMKPEYDSWKKSSHYKPTKENPNVKSIQVANCKDCHLPPWNKPISMLWAKAYHGTKDVYHHYYSAEEFKYPGFYYEMKVKSRESIYNESCIKCHQDILKSNAPDIKPFHKSFKNIDNLKCVDCHQNLIH